MKKFSLALLALATALAIAPRASADPLITGTIYVYGTDSFTGSSITVDPTAYISSGIFPETPLTGSFASAGLANTTATILSSTITTLPEEFLTGSDGLDFWLDSYTIQAQSAETWTIVGTGTFDLTGYDSTLFNFTYTSTNVNEDAGNVLFTANAAPSPTPEPSSLLLLGTGLLGLAFVAFRKAKASGVVLSMQSV